MSDPDRNPVVAIVHEELMDALDGYGLHTGGSFGVEIDHEDKLKIMETAAQRIVARLTITEPAAPGKES